MFIPALERHPEEAALIGLLVAGYSALDMTYCYVCGQAVGDQTSVLEALHKIESEAARIDIGNSLTKHVFKSFGLESAFGEVVGGMQCCRKIRNQYAHAQWFEYDGILRFKRASQFNFKKPFQDIPFDTISVHVLQLQKSYYGYVRNNLLWLESQLVGPETDVQKPPYMPQAPLRAASDKHIPRSQT